MSDGGKRIYVAGHQGMVGSAIVRRLRQQGHAHLIVRTRAELDLTDQAAVREMFASEKPDEVYLAAARVGGIHANNTYPAEFIHANLMIQCNVIQEAWRCGTRKLLFLGSSCIYPRLAAQPMTEAALLEGKLEPTNEPYAIAKIAGIKLCESYNRQYGTDFRSVMPTNLFGPGDNYHPHNSHVVPALIRRFHEAKLAKAPSVTVWGTGHARREFLFVDDMADACVHTMALPAQDYAAHTTPMCSHVNVGTGEDLPISELATLVAQVVGYRGALKYDADKPDGAPRKLLDVSLMQRLGWRARTPLREGLQLAYADFLARQVPSVDAATRCAAAGAAAPA